MKEDLKRLEEELKVLRADIGYHGHIDTIKSAYRREHLWIGFTILMVYNFILYYMFESAAIVVIVLFVINYAIRRIRCSGVEDKLNETYRLEREIDRIKSKIKKMS